MKKYCAYGLLIESEIPIVEIPETFQLGKADIQIQRGDLSNEQIKDNEFLIEDGRIMFKIPDIGKFKVTNGNLIKIDAISGCSKTLLEGYLMGVCMGAVFHQLGKIPFHGSCVTNGKYTVMITGDSGAGKSTLASEFISHGWRFMTDDITVIENIEETPLVQSGFPSQKLCRDSLKQYNPNMLGVHSLYDEENKVKYGISAIDHFNEGRVPITHIIRLIPADMKTGIWPVNGLAKVDHLIHNTYLLYMITKNDRQRHFQRCVTLARKVPMSLLIRKQGEQNAALLYEMLHDTLRKDYVEKSII